MEEIPITEFKAKCQAIVERVRKTGKAVRITRRGKPIADIVPSPPPPKAFDRAKWIGSMKGSVKILGDIVSPASDPDEWEALRD